MPRRSATTAGIAVGVCIYQLSFFAAVKLTGVAVGTVVAIGTGPAAAGILGRLVNGERLTRRWALATLAAAAGVALLAGTILPYNTASPDQNARMREVNDWIAGAGVPWVDTRAAAADPRDPDRLASSTDDLHPSAEGYRRMAEAIGPALEALLRRGFRLR
jgi:lysophospholipase L1-like esterase